ncbi:MAG: Multicopper oxidase, partial [uncultured Thermomicrobiales bacterium]
LDFQRPGARPDAARQRGGTAARPLHQRLRPPPHDALPRHPQRLPGRRHRHRPRRRPARRAPRLRVRGQAVRRPPLPLPHHPAEAPHPQGALRQLHRQPRPEAARRRGQAPPPRPRRIAGVAGVRHGDERLRHDLRRGERGLRRQHRRLPLHEAPDPGRPHPPGPDLPLQPRRVRPVQLLPLPRQLLRLLRHRHHARADAAHGRHDRPDAGPAGNPGAQLQGPRAGALHVPRPRLGVRGAGLDGRLRRPL